MGVSFELFRLDLLRALHLVLDLALEVGDRDDHKTGLTRVESFAELLEVLAADAGGRVPGDGAEQRTASSRRGEETSADRGRGEQRDDEPRRETDTTAQHTAGARRRLVLLH